jgi:cyclophilin family peptidyl-prolyl cis-trans isomerase/HEAT repeat protein
LTFVFFDLFEIPMRFFLNTFIVALVVSGCTSKPNKFSDPAIVKIADFQDRRQTDSLIHFLLDRNPVYRTEAAVALGSVQDSIASLQLGSTLLEDPFVEARKAAAFALGQTGGVASVNALIPALEDKDGFVVREALVALGKTVTKNDLDVLKKFRANDTLTQSGLAWAFYHVGLRGLADSVVVSKEKNFLHPTYSYQTRLAAAHFFSRGAKLSRANFNSELITAATEDQSPFVRMAAASALRKIDSVKSIDPLIKIISTDRDYRVRIGAVRSLATVDANRAAQAVINSLDDVDENVGIAASEALRPIAMFREQILAKARMAKNVRIQSNLYKAALTILATPGLVAEVKALYVNSKNEYQRSALLNSLSALSASYPFIAEELIASNVFVIQTAAAQALANINSSKQFDGKWKKEFAALYEKAILKGDAGVTGIVAATLSDPALNYKETISNFSFLTEAKKKLSLPKDIEALQPLNEAIAYFEGKEKPLGPKNQFNHPVNWELAKSIKKDQRVRIQTERGEIIVRLFVEEAPGSVANFVELINKKYFDGKNFHRVVPNFVVQGGCNRGDGFGSEDYSIRSEFSMRNYKEGSLGMASAGKDTEGTQWFITHSPTPHLNGRYTIFAEVESGMEVVHAIQVGDLIVKVSLL